MISSFFRNAQTWNLCGLLHTCPSILTKISHPIISDQSIVPEKKNKKTLTHPRKGISLNSSAIASQIGSQGYSKKSISSTFDQVSKGYLLSGSRHSGLLVRGLSLMILQSHSLYRCFWSITSLCCRQSGLTDSLPAHRILWFP